MEQTEQSNTNRSPPSGVEKFKGPTYLTRFEPDPDALAVLADIDSVTSTRLHKLSRGEWPGIISIEDYLGPLAQSEGTSYFALSIHPEINGCGGVVNHLAITSTGVLAHCPTIRTIRSPTVAMGT